jgi:hypothetical protein
VCGASRVGIVITFQAHAGPRCTDSNSKLGRGEWWAQLSGSALEDLNWDAPLILICCTMFLAGQGGC